MQEWAFTDVIRKQNATIGNGMHFVLYRLQVLKK